MANSSTTALQLESLNERTVPSVTVVQNGGILTVKGDQFANNVQITDDGTASGLTVTVDGMVYPVTGPVDSVHVRAGSGKDSVSYSLTGDYVGIARTINVALGNGDDTFTADLSHGIDATSSLTLLVDGGNGKDALSVTGPATGSTAVLAGALTIDLKGNNGMDTLSFAYAAEVDGSLTITARGGNGKDTITGDVNVAAGSTGAVTIHEFGGNGKDVLGLSVAGDGLAGLSALLDATIDGGHGQDTVTATDNVTILNPGKHK
ncbi:MAG TPA: hypothetical protein VHR66_12580 [Gemmataceae bacterium]|jgi:hypothetical protein|nr:hypothetical protein [Gemmataceae bacterium]